MIPVSFTKRALNLVRKLNLSTDANVSPKNRMVRAYIYGFDENVPRNNRLSNASVDVEIESSVTVEQPGNNIRE